jgi:hypothetical protein
MLYSNESRDRLSWMRNFASSSMVSTSTMVRRKTLSNSFEFYPCRVISKSARQVGLGVNMKAFCEMVIAHLISPILQKKI